MYHGLRTKETLLYLPPLVPCGPTNRIHVNELAEDRKAAAINNSYHHLLMAAPYRACIRCRSSQPDFRDFGDRYPVIPGSREIFQPDFESKFLAWRQRLLMGFEYLLRVFLDRAPIEID